MTDSHHDQLERGDRFDFGANWNSFLKKITDERIEASTRSLLSRLARPSLAELRFLDVGSGSGLSSLAANRAGAKVTSFDFDPQCVACTAELRRRYAVKDGWTIATGSALDPEFLQSLGVFDVVYSWGVLHHTGQMWHALDLVCDRVAAGGVLFIALYNDQGWISRYWKWVKQRYNRVPALRAPILLLHAPYFLAVRAAGNLLRALKGEVRNSRGMSFWTDVTDWLGGYPFEVATPEDVTSFLEARRFRKSRIFSAGRRHGCNEFVFVRES